MSSDKVMEHAEKLY